MDAVLTAISREPMHDGQCVELLAWGLTAEEVLRQIQHHLQQGLLERDADGRLCLSPMGEDVVGRA
jgi:hypothetical protein